MTRPALVPALALLLSAVAATPVVAARATQSAALPAPTPAGPPRGYYRMPALSGDTLVFVAEGDLWRVPATGGTATRLTTHPGSESRPRISPDGTRIAFAATYEGPREVYVMPLAGGLPRRITHDGGRHVVDGWTPDGQVLVATDAFSRLPDWQLLSVDPETLATTRWPLSQAADGRLDAAGRSLFFVRVFQGSHTKRYQGGTAQQIWRLDRDAAEAVPLTTDYPGTSKDPSWWDGRVVFASDRDGTMNVWSMRPDGSDLRQHTRHAGWDVKDLSPVSGGRVAYQLGADLHVLDLATGTDRAVPVTLDSDLDQTREQWVEKPPTWITSAHLSPDGDRVALTARGQVFVAPVKQGRLVEASHERGVRWRDARFLPDGKRLVGLSDASGEVEVWTLPANGVGEPEELTSDGEVLRWEAVPSPDGKWVAHHDKNQRLWLLDVARGKSVLVEANPVDGVRDLAWSPDSRWLAYVSPASNNYSVIRLHGVDGKVHVDVTTDRFDSHSPAFSPDGKWLYFLSERHLVSLVGSPWGPMQPEPYFDRTTQVFQIALEPGTRSPFAPADELHPDAPDDDAKGGDQDGHAGQGKKGAKGSSRRDAPPPEVTIDVDGLAARLLLVPVPPGNYSALALTDKRLLLLDTDRKEKPVQRLVSAPIKNRDIELATLVDDVDGFELSLDRKKALVRKDDALHVIDAGADKAVELGKTAVDLSGWTLSVTPREEWRQMFAEAWRLERDYFYDPGMHGVDWAAMREKYAPLVDRVSDREELADLVAQMVSELSALHTFVYGGDVRQGEDQVAPGSLGAETVRDEAAGGERVVHVRRSDPDDPERRSPLAAPGVDVKDGDVITLVDGVRVLDAPALGALLRNKAGHQVLLRVRDGATRKERDVVVVLEDGGAARDRRLHEWELERRERVEEAGGGDIGYVHLRTMGRSDYADWARGYYPVFDRKALVVDVRHNGGGNIDSWILSRLMRKVWFYWTQRVGRAPSWNMQWAFRGHVVVLCDERTGSDGEAFTEGFRRLGLGKVIGTRTWGGEIWLTSSNVLVDRGIATAAEYGVYGPEGTWLIEGHGVDPDIVVDNLPRATFEGGDAQLDAAVAHLQKLLREQPVELPPEPAHPDKSFGNGR